MSVVAMSASPPVLLYTLLTMNLVAKAADFRSTFGYLSFGRHRSKAILLNLDVRLILLRHIYEAKRSLYVKTTYLRPSSVRLQPSAYQRINCLLDFSDIQWRRSLPKIVKGRRASCISAKRQSYLNIYAVQQNTQCGLMSKFYSALMLARHVSDLIGPLSGAFFTSRICRLWYVVISVLLDTSSHYEVTAGRVE